MEEAKQVKVEMSEAATSEEVAKRKGLTDDEIMEVKEVIKEPNSPTRETSASIISGLGQKLGFKKKTKVVIKVDMAGVKDLNKVMKFVAGFTGVSSVRLGAQDKNQLEVIGDGFDPVKLTTFLRKKFDAKLISVAPVLKQTKDSMEDEPMLQHPTSSSASHHINPINKAVVDSVETEKLNGELKMEMDTKASTYSNVGTENAGSLCKSKTTEWTLLITSLLLEGMSAIFEQLGCTLTGMVTAFLALLLSIVDLIHKARKEGITSDRWSLLPCFHRHLSHNSPKFKPFGSLVEYFGLAGAVWQCSYSTIAYYYTHQNKNNPIRMCLLPFLLALCVVISKLVKSSPDEPLAKLEPA